MSKKQQRGNPMKRQVFEAIAFILILPCCVSLAADDKPIAVAPLKLQQIVSREDPKFDCERASLTVGRDGMVYLTSAGHDSGYILRVSRDGRNKLGGASVPAIHNATADAGGRIAASHGHFSHQAAIYDREFRKTQAITDFLVNDQVGWDAPAGVEAGASGDFYGLDQHRDRILQFNTDGKIVKAYALPHIDKRSAQGFRVCEKAKVFYVFYWGKAEVQCVGFDGKLKWERILGVGADIYEGDNGGFDVDPDGVLYTIASQDIVLRKTDPKGKPAGEIRLNIPPQRRFAERIHGMRVWGGEVILRRRHPTELFQVYDLASGDPKRSVSIDHERLSVTAQGGPWIAGQAVDFRIEFDGGGRRIMPKWRVWARPFGVLDYRELNARGQVAPSRGLCGCVSDQGDAGNNPLAAALGNKRIQGSNMRGSPDGGRPGQCRGRDGTRPRLNFGRGEEIPLAIYMRGNAPKDTELTVILRDGSRTLAAARASSIPRRRKSISRFPSR